MKVYLEIIRSCEVDYDVTNKDGTVNKKLTDLLDNLIDYCMANNLLESDQDVFDFLCDLQANDFTEFNYYCDEFCEFEEGKEDIKIIPNYNVNIEVNF